MNLKKVKSILSNIGDVLENDYPDNKEFLIIVGNMLRFFALNLIEKDSDLKDLNPDDANQVSILAMQYPESVPLAILLQSHVLIKLSESFKDE